MLHGEYSEQRYVICSAIGSDDHEIYRAGNNPLESSSEVEPVQGVGLSKMRGFCWSTMRELAKERKEDLGTIRRNDDLE